LSGSVTASNLRKNLWKFLKCVIIALKPATGIHYTDPLVNAVSGNVRFTVQNHSKATKWATRTVSNVTVDGITVTTGLTVAVPACSWNTCYVITLLKTSNLVYDYKFKMSI
jgi:hypothetical protein